MSEAGDLRPLSSTLNISFSHLRYARHGEARRRLGEVLVKLLDLVKVGKWDTNLGIFIHFQSIHPGLGKNPSRNPSEAIICRNPARLRWRQQRLERCRTWWCWIALHHFMQTHFDWWLTDSRDCVIQGLAPQQPFGTLPRQMLQRKWCSSCRILIRDGYWISVLQWSYKFIVPYYLISSDSLIAFSKLELSFVLVLTLYSSWPGGPNEILATRRDCWWLPLADLALCWAACGVTVYTLWTTLNLCCSGIGFY